MCKLYERDAGKDYGGEREQGATLARCKWTAQVALVLCPPANGEDDTADTDSGQGTYSAALSAASGPDAPCPGGPDSRE